MVQGKAANLYSDWLAITAEKLSYPNACMFYNRKS